MLLAAIGLALYQPLFELRPFEEDNVYVLAWAAATPASAIVAVDPYYYPEWRPLAYATIWIERAAGAPIALSFAVNLALWIACAWLSYRLTRELTRSAIAGVLAGILVLTDPRATWTLVTIVERQTSLACLFGLLALWLAVTDRTLTRPRLIGIGALLVATALSKEFGLAFAAAVGAGAVMTGRRNLAWPAVAAVAVYGLLRWQLADGGTRQYCEDMYFFGTLREVCLDASPASLAQLAYNAAATLINLPLLGVLSSSGAPTIAESRLATGLVFTALAILAIARMPRASWVIAVVVVANALLSAPIYRDRNQLAGACALAILAGAGLPHAMRLLTARVARVAAVAVITALLGAQAVLASALVVERQVLASQIDPCDLEIMDRPFVPPLVEGLNAHYGVRNRRCEARE